MTAIEPKRLRGAHAIPSPNDWADWQQRVEDGEDPKAAANARGLTLSNYRRADFERQREILALSREARADEADRRLEKWVSVDDASDQMRTYWHRYHANRAGRVQEQIRLEGKVDSDVADALDRFTEMVAAAAVRQSAGAGERPADGGPQPEVESPARLQVAGLGGQAGSGAA
jgi:hypothetical protein